MKDQIKIKKIKSLSEATENDGFVIVTSYSFEDIVASIKDSIKILVENKFISSHRDISQVYFLETSGIKDSDGKLFREKNALMFAFTENAKVNIPLWLNTLGNLLTQFTTIFKLNQNND